MARIDAWLRRPGYRRTLLLAALHTALIWGMATGVVWQDYRESIDELKVAAENLSFAVTAHVAQTMQPASLLLNSVAGLVESEGVESEDEFRRAMTERRLFEVLRNRVVGMPQVGMVAIAAANGDVLNSLMSWPPSGINVADREGFKAAMAESPPRLVIEPTVRGMSDGRPRFFLAQKLVSRSGATLGAIAVGLDAGFFASFFRSLSLGAEGWVSLFREDATLLATSLADQELLGKRYPQAVSYRLLQSGQARNAIITGERAFHDPASAVHRVVAVRMVEGLPAYVAIATADTTHLAAWRERSIVIAGIAILLTLLTVGATLHILQLIDRSEASRRAESERQVLAAIVNTPSALAAIVSREGEILHCNKGFRELLGGGDDGGAGALRNPALKGADKLIAFAMEERQGAAEVDLELEQRGQTRRLHFSLSRQSLPDSGDCVVMVGHDETERRQAQQAIALTARLVALGEITTSIAHELSQPLNVIRMAAQNALLEAKPEAISMPGEEEPVPPMSDREFRDFAVAKLDRVVRQVDRAAEVLARMRVFSRRPSQEVSAFDVAKACRHALALLAPQLRRDGIVVTERFPTEPLIARAPETIMEQAVIFILRNAREALIESGQTEKTIEISVRQAPNGRVVTRIADNGPGVPAGIRDRIFEPFFSTKSNDLHAGLGLTLVFGTMRDAGGELRLVGDQPGGVFEIELPTGPGPAG
jgi:C4-dicarboxylate-specific signal transduction histidine kinase